MTKFISFNLQKELNTALYTGEGSTKTSFSILDDSHSTKWIVLKMENSMICYQVYLLLEMHNSNGGGENIIGLVFEFFFMINKLSRKY